MAEYPNDSSKIEPIPLPNNRQTSIKLGFDRKGKSGLEPGDKISVASSAVSVLGAHLNPETGNIDVVPVDGAFGPAAVAVNVTLADGTVLPEQSVAYDVTHPDANAVVLTPSTDHVAKASPVLIPLLNAEPHVVPEPLPAGKKDAAYNLTLVTRSKADALNQINGDGRLPAAAKAKLAAKVNALREGSVHISAWGSAADASDLQATVNS